VRQIEGPGYLRQSEGCGQLPCRIFLSTYVMHVRTCDLCVYLCVCVFRSSVPVCVRVRVRVAGARAGVYVSAGGAMQK